MVYPDHRAFVSHHVHERALMAVRSHLLDVYDVHLHVATDRRQWATLRRRHPKLTAPDGEFGSANTFGESPTDSLERMHVAFYVNVAAHNGDKGALLDTVAHEATHGACKILDAASATYDGSSEPLAYLVAWLTRWLWEATT